MFSRNIVCNNYVLFEIKNKRMTNFTRILQLFWEEKKSTMIQYMRQYVLQSNKRNTYKHVLIFIVYDMFKY